jgi:hypothetical protein
MGFIKFVHILFDARAFKWDTLRVPECFQRLRVSCSFFIILKKKWTCYFKVLEAPTKSKSIKICKLLHQRWSYLENFGALILILCHFWEIRWFIFNELTVHSTRSPIKHCPISKRKNIPGFRALPEKFATWGRNLLTSYIQIMGKILGIAFQ